VKHRVDADGFKVRDAGAAENQFLKHVRCMHIIHVLIFRREYVITVRPLDPSDGKRKGDD
jgi:hypothetical protein